MGPTRRDDSLRLQRRPSRLPSASLRIGDITPIEDVPMVKSKQFYSV